MASSFRSLGQNLLKRMVLQLLGKITIEENFRPIWLDGLEIDLWLPELNIGFEFDGDQHVIPVYGVDNLLDQVGRDVKKLKICNLRGVLLITIEAHELRLGTIKDKIREAIYCAHLLLGNEIDARYFSNSFTKRILKSRKKRPGVKYDDTLNEQADKYREGLRSKYVAPSAFEDRYTRLKVVKMNHRIMDPEAIKRLGKLRTKKYLLRYSKSRRRGGSQAIIDMLHATFPLPKPKSQLMDSSCLLQLARGR